MNNNYNTKETEEIKGIIDKINEKVDRNGREYLIVVLEAKEFGSNGDAIFVFNDRDKWKEELEVGREYIFTVKSGTNKPEAKILVDANWTSSGEIG